jgi:hypothetical protein
MPRRRKAGTLGARKARFGVYLDPGTRAALLTRAIQECTSATELVERLITEYLAATRTRREPKGR